MVFIWNWAPQSLGDLPKDRGWPLRLEGTRHWGTWLQMQCSFPWILLDNVLLKGMTFRRANARIIGSVIRGEALHSQPLACPENTVHWAARAALLTKVSSRHVAGQLCRALIRGRLFATHLELFIVFQVTCSRVWVDLLEDYSFEFMMFIF